MVFCMTISSLLYGRALYDRINFIQASSCVSKQSFFAWSVSRTVFYLLFPDSLRNLSSDILITSAFVCSCFTEYSTKLLYILSSTRTFISWRFASGSTGLPGFFGTDTISPLSLLSSNNYIILLSSNNVNKKGSEDYSEPICLFLTLFLSFRSDQR